MVYCEEPVDLLEDEGVASRSHFALDAVVIGEVVESLQQNLLGEDGLPAYVLARGVEVGNVLQRAASAGSDHIDRFEGGQEDLRLDVSPFCLAGLHQQRVRHLEVVCALTVPVLSFNTFQNE